MGIRRTPIFSALLLGLLLQFSGELPSTGATEMSAPLHWLVSVPTFSPPLERELSAIVREFNEINSDVQVQVHFRGEDYSTLRQLSVASLAGTLPDLAMIEPSEADSLIPLSLPLSAPSPELKTLKIDAGYFQKSRPNLIPLFRALPVLVIDQEILLRAGLDAKQLPRDWPSFERLTRKLIESGSTLDDSQGQFALALPFSGPRALFALEAILGKPLWIYEPMRLAVNPTIRVPLNQVRELFRTPRLSRSPLGWEQSIQAFVERKAPLLVTSTDSLPMISGRATFRWIAVPLPQAVGGSSRLATGADLVVCHPSKGLNTFLKYLYSPRVAARWSTSGGFIPLHSSWIQSTEWKHAAEAQPALLRILQDFTTSPIRIQARAPHPEIMRIRGEWATQMGPLWSEPTEQKLTSSVLNQIDLKLKQIAVP